MSKHYEVPVFEMTQLGTADVICASDDVNNGLTPGQGSGGSFDWGDVTG